MSKRTELVELQAENDRLKTIIERVSEADDVALAYQQVYFEDERSWKDERTRRIAAEADLAILRAACGGLSPDAVRWALELLTNYAADHRYNDEWFGACPPGVRAQIVRLVWGG